MRTIITALAAAAVAVAAFSETAVASPAAAHVAVAKKPITSGFYRGRTIRYYDFGPIKLQPGNKIAPIWAVTNGVGGQHNIVDTVPGQASYTPLWRVNRVTFKPGATRRVLRSRADVEAARRRGEVTVTADNVKTGRAVMKLPEIMRTVEPAIGVFGRPWLKAASIS